MIFSRIYSGKDTDLDLIFQELFSELKLDEWISQNTWQKSPTKNTKKHHLTGSTFEKRKNFIFGGQKRAQDENRRLIWPLRVPWSHLWPLKTVFAIVPILCHFSPIYAICTPFYSTLRQQPCSNESTFIKYTIWGTCKKNFSVLAQTV